MICRIIFLFPDIGSLINSSNFVEQENENFQFYSNN